MIGSYISKYFIEGKTENEILEIFQKSIKTNEINFDITKDEIKESCKELGWNYEIII
jgi:tellurite resistance protein